MTIIRYYKYNNTRFDNVNDLIINITANTSEGVGLPLTQEDYDKFGIELVEIDTDANKTLRQWQNEFLERLDDAFMKWRNDEATFISSLGFEVDGDSRAMQDITGLVTVANSNPEFTTTFMDANNNPHELNVDQIKILAMEIIQSATDGYNQKWAKRNEIENVTDKYELGVIDLRFEPSDFTVKSETKSE